MSPLLGDLGLIVLVSTPKLFDVLIIGFNWSKNEVESTSFVSIGSALSSHTYIIDDVTRGDPCDFIVDITKHKNLI